MVRYNKRLFDQAQLSYPSANWSWEDFLNAAGRLTVRDGDEVVRYGFVDPMPNLTLPLLVHQSRGPLVDRKADGTEGLLDKPEVIETLQRYVDLVTVHRVMPDVSRIDPRQRSSLPQDQPFGMWLGTASSLGEYSNLYQSTGILPLPGGGEGCAGGHVSGYFISAGTAHPDAAWEWIEFLSRQPPDPTGRGLSARRSVNEESGFWQRLDDDAKSVYEYALEHAVHYP